MTYRNRAYWRMAIWVISGGLLIVAGILLGRLVVRMINDLTKETRKDWAYLIVALGVPGLVLVSHLMSAFCIRALDFVLSGLSPLKLDNQIHYLKEQKNRLLRNQICLNCEKMAYVCSCDYPTWVKIDPDAHRPDGLDKETKG